MKPIWSWSFGPETFAVLAILPTIARQPFPDTLHYVTIRDQVVEARLKEFAGNNKQHETTLKRLLLRRAVRASTCQNSRCRELISRTSSA